MLGYQTTTDQMCDFSLKTIKEKNRKLEAVCSTEKHLTDTWRERPLISEHSVLW